jgi:LmbE family N-acetylglucosaminyl deacetylase
MWIYLSPHFDDAVFSCGGLIWQQSQAGQAVEIWTVCAGDIPSGPLTPFAQELHARWGTGLASVEVRRAEDEAACRIVGAAWRHFSLPDCIYRRLPPLPGDPPDAGAPVITRNDDLWLPVSPGEASLVNQVADWLRQGLEQAGPDVRLVSPLGVGGHIDHRLVRAAAENLGRPLWYYADYPYAVKNGFDPVKWLGKNRQVYARPISKGAVCAWQAATAAYDSQLSSFWPGLEKMRLEIFTYAQTPQGHSLFR